MRYMLITLLAVSSLHAQERLDRIREVIRRHLEQPVTCARLTSQVARGGTAEVNVMEVYGDNREGIRRIFVRPRYLTSYYYDGNSMYCFSDQKQTYFKLEGDAAIYQVRDLLDNISTALLARRLPPAEGTGGVPGEIETGEWLADSMRRIIVSYPDDPSNQITNSRQELWFDDRSGELVLDRLTYLFMGDSALTEVRLDTVYSDVAAVDGKIREMTGKLSTYAYDMPREPENSRAIYDLSKIRGAWSLVQPMPDDSDYILVDFFFVACPPCLKAVPILKRLYAEYPETKLAIVGINDVDNRARIEKYIESYKPPYAIAMLDKEFTAREIGHIIHPTFVLFDRTGNVVWDAVGYTESMEAEIRSILDR